MEKGVMDKEVEEAIENVTKMLDDVNELMDTLRTDVSLLAEALDELNVMLYPDEDFGPTGAYVNQDPDLKK
jgi:hypothetical protein|tara:strand:+ start:338 stop:550 length:213 start_codon:yes stop_codon:yes gene_type:complete